MPRRDGTGPLGQGPATGRGLGPCGKGGALGKNSRAGGRRTQKRSPRLGRRNRNQTGGGFGQGGGQRSP